MFISQILDEAGQIAVVVRDGGEAASQPEQKDTAMDRDDCGASAEDDEDEDIDEFD
jgi:hypothetical protein